MSDIARIRSNSMSPKRNNNISIHATGAGFDAAAAENRNNKNKSLFNAIH